MPSDPALTADEALFEGLYREAVAPVHSLARRLLGPSRADDATQEVFLRVWRKLHTFRGEGSLQGWVRRVALTELLNQRRGVRPVGPLDQDPPAAPARPDVRLDLEAAVSALPAGAREVFLLHDVEGLPHAEIAARLGVSAGTSKSQLHRARLLLREHLGPGEPPHA